MPTQTFLVTTENTDLSTTDLLNLIEKEGARWVRPIGTNVVEFVGQPSIHAPVTTNLLWKVKQNGNVVASCITAEDALTTMSALATASSEGLTGWSLHFDMTPA